MIAHPFLDLFADRRRLQRAVGPECVEHPRDGLLNDRFLRLDGRVRLLGGRHVLGATRAENLTRI